MKCTTDPDSWPDLLELLQSWWRGDTPLGAVIMSIVMAGFALPILAVVVTGDKNASILLCGALTLTLHPLLSMSDGPNRFSVAIGGGVGLIGVDAVGWGCNASNR